MHGPETYRQNTSADSHPSFNQKESYSTTIPVHFPFAVQPIVRPFGEILDSAARICFFFCSLNAVMVEILHSQRKYNAKRREQEADFGEGERKKWRSFVRNGGLK